MKKIILAGIILSVLAGCGKDSSSEAYNASTLACCGKLTVQESKSFMTEYCTFPASDIPGNIPQACSGYSAFYPYVSTCSDYNKQFSRTAQAPKNNGPCPTN